MMLEQRMGGVERMGEEGLLFCRIGVRVGGAAAAHAETPSDQRSPPKAVSPPTQAVGAGPAKQEAAVEILMKNLQRMKKEINFIRAAPPGKELLLVSSLLH